VLPVFLSSYVLVPFNLDPVVRNELKGKMTTPHMVFFCQILSGNRIGNDTIECIYFT
jgi:hypothetical protein